MLKVTDEMLTGMEEIFKTQLQVSDVLAVWNAEAEEMQLEIYQGVYKIRLQHGLLLIRVGALSYEESVG